VASLLALEAHCPECGRSLAPIGKHMRHMIKEHTNVTIAIYLWLAIQDGPGSAWACPAGRRLRRPYGDNVRLATQALRQTRCTMTGRRRDHGGHFTELISADVLSMSSRAVHPLRMSDPGACRSTAPQPSTGS
jgi:hypothetical protein